MSTLTPEQQQPVIQERAELLARIEAIQTLIAEKSVSPGEQSRLTRQLVFMQGYEGVLSERIEEFPPEAKK